MNRLQAALLALSVAVGLAVAGAIHRANVERRRRDEARQLVDAVVARYPGALKGDEQATRDPWGRPLQVERQDGVFEGYVVTSSGPDGAFATRDDISARKHVATHLEKAGQSFGKGLGDFGVGIAKGLYKSAREHLRDK